MEIKEPKIILKYLNITLLSYSRYCYFSPGKDGKERIRARFLMISNGRIQLSLNGIPQKSDGFIVFHSYTYIFRFRTRLSSDSEPGIYYCDIPKEISTYDQRRYSRLIFESKENKVISMYNKDLGQSLKAILTDISAGGIGLVVPDPDNVPKEGDLVVASISLWDKTIKTFAKVIQIRGNQVGCSFFDKSNEFQIQLNKIIIKEIQWRSEIMLRNLKKREEVMQKVRREKLQAETADKATAVDVQSIEPVIEYFVSQMEAVSGVLLNKKEAVYQADTLADFATALYFVLNFNEASFRCFFYGHASAVYKIAKAVLRLNDTGNGKAVNANEILVALGQQLAKQSTKPQQSEILGEITEPAVTEANKRLLTSLSKHASVKVKFGSTVGDFNLFFMADNLHEAIMAASKSRKFITMDKLDLMEPLSYSTINVFTHMLQLETREKSVTTRDRLLPKFDITILLDIFFDNIEGKVVLNLSKKLALKIYELLVNEKREEFDDDVKDAMAELTNIITGNAKNEFEKSGIYYKLSTPIVLDCKQSAIVYVKNMKFLSSIYWTSEGFFELSFSFYQKDLDKSQSQSLRDIRAPKSKLQSKQSKTR